MASGDLGAPAYRKFDVEAWMPGLGRYGEVLVFLLLSAVGVRLELNCLILVHPILSTTDIKCIKLYRLPKPQIRNPISSTRIDTDNFKEEE